MTDYKIVGKSIKKVFVSEILEMASVLLSVIAVLGALCSLIFVKDNAQIEGLISFGGTLVCIIGGVVLAVLAMILQIVGLKKASDQYPMFSMAYYMVIFELLCVVAMSAFSIISYLGGTTSVWYNMISTLKEIFNILATVYIIDGCAAIVAEKGREDLAIEGANLLTTIVILYVMGCFLNIIPMFTPNIIDAIAYGIYMIVEAIAFIIFLSFLARTRRVLNSK